MTDAGAVSIAGVALHLRGAVRGHYFDWLTAARPDLVRLHRGRFRRGAYQEDAERERIDGIVRAAARRCGVTGRDRYRGSSPAASPAEDGEQGRDGDRAGPRDAARDRVRAEGEQLQLL